MSSRKTGHKAQSTKRRPRRDAQLRSIEIHATHPPQINPQITHHQRMRFLANAAGSQVVTFQNLLDALLVCTSATVGYDLYDVVKVKKVEMWCQGVTNAPTTLSVDFSGGIAGAAGTGRFFSDTSMGVEPAHVVATPGRDNACAFWQGSSSLVAFVVTNANETVIDVEVTYRNAVVTPVACANALVAGAVGQVYYRGLDGLATAGTKYPSLAYDTI